MGAKVLVLSSSPRRAGNCEFLAREAVAAIGEGGSSVEEVSLASLKILPCSACDLCRSGKVKYCAIHDDMEGLYEKVLACESILFVTPIYWFTYNAQLKTFIDRLYGLWNWDNDFLKAKKTGAVLVYGDVDIYASGAINAVSTFDHMLRFLGANNLGYAYGTANDPGDAASNAELVEATRSLAKRLA